MKVLIILFFFSLTFAKDRLRRQVSDVPWWEIITDDDVQPPNPPQVPLPEINSNVGPPIVDNKESVGEAQNDETNPSRKQTVEIHPHEYCDVDVSKCVPFYQCDDPGVVVQRGGFDSLGTGKGGTCERHLDVCCRSINKHQPTPPIYSNRACSGIRNVNGLGVKLNNLHLKETQFGEFPWMVAILRIERIGNAEINLYECGGSLIADNMVLTAAHCVSDIAYPGDARVRAGEWDTQQDYEMYTDLERDVEDIFIHPGFNPDSLWNNFAILKLATPFFLGPSLNTVCLPDKNQIFLNRTVCYATGWGKDKFGKEGQFQNILKKVDLPLIPHSECNDILKTTRLSEYFILDDSFMCAGGEPGKDTCTGDGGSPLVCNLPGENEFSKYYQVGIVSWGLGCGEEGVPGVYADVRYAKDWVDYILLNGFPPV